MRSAPTPTASSASADGSALAFFQFARPEDQKLFGPKMPDSPFHHIALNVDQEVQAGIEKRLRAGGYTEPKIYILEHGYCRSLYVADPDGMICEFTVDHPDAEKINVAEEGDRARRPQGAGSPAITSPTTCSVRSRTDDGAAVSLHAGR